MYHAAVRYCYSHCCDSISVVGRRCFAHSRPAPGERRPPNSGLPTSGLTPIRGACFYFEGCIATPTNPVDYGTLLVGCHSLPLTHDGTFAPNRQLCHRRVLSRF